MFIVFILIVIGLFFAGLICAIGAYTITKKRWVGILAMLCSLITPCSLVFMHAARRTGPVICDICDFGYFYAGFVPYFSVFCCCAFLFHKFVKKINLRKVLSLGICAVISILILGYWNCMNPVLKEIQIPSTTNARICFVSDIHLGCINTKVIFNRILKLIEQSKPDIVVFGGDMMDINGVRDYSQFFLESMKKITSKYRTYTVIGNHEVYSGIQDCVNLMKKAGIRVLLDESVTVSCGADNNKITIVGRLDQVAPHKKSLKEIIFSTSSFPILVVDHTPNFIDESVKNNVLLHLSGHTHAGQMFPLNIITDILFEPTGVLGKIHDTYFYISNGAGFWGPPYRLGNKPEVVVINMTSNHIF